MNSQHIILIGFKNSGKSTVGSALAEKLHRTFLDLDDEIQKSHQEQTGEKLSCRQIMKNHGEAHFRTLEREVLHLVVRHPKPLVIAVGGGTPMLPENRLLLQKHLIIHVSAPKSIVFERIMINGKPAFFPQNQEPFQSFQELWKQREPVFEELAQITVNNVGSVDDAVQKIQKQLSIL